MSRSGYSDDLENWELICWRGAVKSALRGKRGQSFLQEMLTALDALPAKRLIAKNLEDRGEVCAIGSVGAKRGVEMSQIDPHDPAQVAAAFNIPRALACEIEYVNDEGCWDETPEHRFARIRSWVVSQIKAEA